MDEGQHDARAQLAQRRAERRRIASGTAATAASRSARASAAAPLASRPAPSAGRAAASRRAKGERRRVRSKAAENDSGKLRSIIRGGRGPSRYNTAKRDPRSVASARDPPSEDSIKAISRSVARVAASLAGAAIVAFLAVVLALRYFVFPQIDDYRDDIAASVSRASGMLVSVDHVDAGWYGLRPQLSMTGVRVADRRGKAYFELERADTTFRGGRSSPATCASTTSTCTGRSCACGGAPTASSTWPTRRSMRLRPTRKARSRWLLAQPRLAIHDATLAWQDELAGAPEVQLRQVEIAIRKAGRRHLAALKATPPAEIAERLDLRADLLFTRRRRAMGGFGNALRRGRPRRPRAAARLPAGARDAAHGNREPARLGGFRAGARARDHGRHEPRGVRARLAEDALPLDLDTLSGRAFYRLQDDGYAVGTRGLSFRTHDGLAAHAADFSLSVGAAAGQPRRGEVRANGVDLKIAAALLDYLPVPREAKAQANRFAPRGRLLDTSLVWTGETLREGDDLPREVPLRGPRDQRGRGLAGRHRTYRLHRRQRARRQGSASATKGDLRGGPFPRAARRRHGCTPAPPGSAARGHRGARRGRAPCQRRRGTDRGRHLPDAARFGGEHARAGSIFRGTSSGRARRPWRTTCPTCSRGRATGSARPCSRGT